MSPISLPAIFLGELGAWWQGLRLFQKLLVLVVKVFVSKVSTGSYIKIPPMIAYTGVRRLVCGLLVRPKGKLVLILDSPAEMLNSLIHILHESAAPGWTAYFLASCLRIHYLSY